MRLAKVGDWVRFKQGGRLVIGVVAYAPECDWNFRQGRASYETDIGDTDDKSILEVRGPEANPVQEDK